MSWHLIAHSEIEGKSHVFVSCLQRRDQSVLVVINLSRGVDHCERDNSLVADILPGSHQTVLIEDVNFEISIRTIRLVVNHDVLESEDHSPIKRRGIPLGVERLKHLHLAGVNQAICCILHGNAREWLDRAAELICQSHCGREGKHYKAIRAAGSGFGTRPDLHT